MRKLVAVFLVVVLCFAYVVPVGMAEGEAETEAPVVLEPTGEPAPEPEPAPEEEPKGEPALEAPTPTPEELFLAAVALLPQDPDALETVTLELEGQLKTVTEQLYTLLTEEQVTALTEANREELSPLQIAALLVLRLNARVTGLNAQAAQTVRDLIAALPPTAEITLDHEPQITAATAAYDALTATQRSLLSEEETTPLTAAQALLTELKAKAKAAAVDEQIALLPEPAALTLSNYQEAKPPAEEAAAALDALSEYERGFVKSAETLQDMLRTLTAFTNAAAWLMRLVGLPATAAQALEQLTMAPGPKSIDTILAIEDAYWRLTSDERGAATAAYNNLFLPVLGVARELAEIREHGRISVFRPSILLWVDDYDYLDEGEWTGISDALKAKYPLTQSLVPGETRISLTEAGVYPRKVIGVAVTEGDAQVLVHGSGANALKELAVPITVKVLPDYEEDEISTKAFAPANALTVNRAYRQFMDGTRDYPLDVVFSIGKYGVIDLSDDNKPTVRFTNTKTPECFSPVTDKGKTFLRYNPTGAGAEKITTYGTKLEYDITLTDGTHILVLTNDIKLSVIDKVAQVALQAPLVNRLWEFTDKDPVTGSYYPAVWLTQTKLPDYGPVTLTAQGEHEGIVTVTWDNTQKQYKLLILDRKFDKDAAWKVKFRVSGGDLVEAREYFITLPISIKWAMPSGLCFDPSPVTYDRLWNRVEANLRIKKGSKWLSLADYQVKSVELVEGATAKYPCQDKFEVIETRNEGDKVYVSYKRKSTVPQYTLPGAFKLLLRVKFNASGAFVDVPVSVVVPSAKVVLEQSTYTLNWPVGGEGYIKIYGTEYNTGDATVIEGTTVDGIKIETADCPLNIHPSGLPLSVGSISGKTQPNKTYNLELVFRDGQTASVKISTKPAPNKLTLSKTSFATDKANATDWIRVTFRQTYLYAVERQLRLARKTGKVWEDVAGVTVKMAGSMWIDFQGISSLPVGKHTLRLYDAAQNIPVENGVTLTVDVKNSKVQFSAAMNSANADVLKADHVLSFSNLKLTGLSDPNGLGQLNAFAGVPGNWNVTVGGDGAKYMEVSAASSSSVTLKWKSVGSYAMRKNGLKPFKLTLQLKDRATGALIAESKPFTVKPTQKPKVNLIYSTVDLLRVSEDPWVTLYPSMAYHRYWLGLDIRNYYDGENYTGEWVAWVAVKGAEKSIYQTYLNYNEGGGEFAHLAVAQIWYKNEAAAKKAKASDTLTLIVMLKNGVVPFEVKLKVKNVK